MQNVLLWYQNALQSTDRVKLLRREMRKTQGWLELARIRSVSELWPLTKAQVWLRLDLMNGFLQNILMTRALREVTPVFQLLLILRRFDHQNAMSNKSAL